MARAARVAMTVEPEPCDYARHRITVERGNAEYVQTLALTDVELLQLELLIGAYRARGKAASAEFSGRSGRSLVMQEEHGRYGVVA